MARCKVTTFCAPPTVWRMLIQQKLAGWAVTLRELMHAFDVEKVEQDTFAQVVEDLARDKRILRVNPTNVPARRVRVLENRRGPERRREHAQDVTADAAAKQPVNA